jgi:hypothetical protein
VTKLDHALRLAAEGFYVFPLEANGKRPAVKAWQHKATGDEAVITRHWTAHPEDNIGIHCGRYKDGQALCVIDVDVKAGKAGLQSLEDLEIIHGDLPRDRVAITPTGGQHIYLVVDTPTRFGAEILGPGLDVRSGNSYVVAPGSTIDGKEYRWA